jgi:hypothetical protein
MTAQAAVQAVSTGAVVTELSGAGVGVDTYPAGCVLLCRNTGAGSHVLTVGVNQTVDGLLAGTTAPGFRTYNFTAGQIQVIRIPNAYGDANGRVTVSVDGTSAEMKLYPLGA